MKQIWNINYFSVWKIVVGMLFILGLGYLGGGSPTSASNPSPTRRINIPFFQGGTFLDQGAIFWFGKVTNTLNYADVRASYNQDVLAVTLHVFDRRLWYDTSPSISDLDAWDGATLYLHLDGNTGNAPTFSSYRFTAQLNHSQARDNYQAALQGNGSGWGVVSTPFTTTTGYRGIFNDSGDDRGSIISFKIPFTSLGLAGPPPQNSEWGMALVLHDRDDAAGTTIPDQTWPETANPQQPSTWGNLYFGLPTYTPPLAVPGNVVTVRHGLNGISVPDAHVGGDTICGEPYKPVGFFPIWGTVNYVGDEGFNVQNQWDVADWPCFSKYFVKFPLDSIPAGKTIISATLSLHQFGNSGGGVWGQPKPSLIQVHTIAEDWNESTITWNDAPLAGENIARGWVNPVDGPLVWPGWERQWDVTMGVASAYASGKPLQLALYSADGDYHSGKYFVSSDTGDWNAAGRPTLRVLWGEPFQGQSVYLPITTK